MADILEEGDEPAIHLAQALREFADTSFSYRTSLYPEVREVVNAFLQFQWEDPESGELQSLGPFADSPDGVSAMTRELRSRGRQVAYHSQQELLARAQTPARLMHAVIERLTDRLLRHESSPREWKGVARSYRDTIWPGEFEAYIATHRSSARLRQAAKELEQQLTVLGGVR